MKTEPVKKVNTMKMNAWNVYLNGKLIDTVFYTKDCDAEYVRKSLIDHDGYNPAIEVRLSRKFSEV